LPSFELPEWADFEDSPLKKVADHYNQIKTKWAERDRLDLAEIRRRFGSIDLGWQKFSTNKGQIWLDSTLLNKLNYTGTSETATDEANNSSKDKLFLSAQSRYLDTLFSLFGSKSGSQKAADDDKVFILILFLYYAYYYRCPTPNTLKNSRMRYSKHRFVSIKINNNLNLDAISARIGAPREGKQAFKATFVTF
jgi:hypothetical protein